MPEDKKIAPVIKPVEPIYQDNTLQYDLPIGVKVDMQEKYRNIWKLNEPNPIGFFESQLRAFNAGASMTLLRTGVRWLERSFGSLPPGVDGDRMLSAKEAKEEFGLDVKGDTSYRELYYAAKFRGEEQFFIQQAFEAADWKEKPVTTAFMIPSVLAGVVLTPENWLLPAAVAGASAVLLYTSISFANSSPTIFLK